MHEGGWSFHYWYKAITFGKCTDSEIHYIGNAYREQKSLHLESVQIAKFITFGKCTDSEIHYLWKVYR